MKSEIDSFLTLSATLTGFGIFRLQGTGQASAYLEAARSVVGPEMVAELLARHARVAASPDAGERDQRLRADILSDPALGPIARNIIKMWYVGTWYQLPAAWRDAYGAREGDTTFVVSPASYVEGLLWPAIGTNPPGAKGPGYGTWAEPPRIPER